MAAGLWLMLMGAGGSIRSLAAPPAGQAPRAKKAEADHDEDEDIDALIEDLESQDGHGGLEEEEEEEGTPGGGRVVPEDMLQTDSRVGLTESEVVARRRKYGLNQMKEEKENLILKFFGYFIGPIQFVMEVSLVPAALHPSITMTVTMSIRGAAAL
ncbi:Plasma membrane ATPase [Tolypocladium ophioglossoides CBS 100239]|uniref:Plasma membrane ATPase n=1 Tax=Tolypocladium ophioglossoides (strain CBS 100239) TaxID=1163406 RepID=A0A0L0NJ02_TOLOC|nr:Plasma membrane ATPase [Tolypocladium ophioglossoides CBS 100239]